MVINSCAKIEFWGIFDDVTATRQCVNFIIKLYFMFSDVDQVLSNQKSANYAFKNLPEEVSI